MESDLFPIKSSYRNEPYFLSSSGSPTETGPASKEAREQDEELLNSLISDQNLTFNEGLAVSKFNELLESQYNEYERFMSGNALEPNGEKLGAIPERRQKEPTFEKAEAGENEEEIEKEKSISKKIEQHLGLVEFREFDSFSSQAVTTWSQEVLKACQNLKSSSSSFSSMMKKRFEVLKRLHIAMLRNRDRGQNEHSETQEEDEENLDAPEEEELDYAVPVVMRLGILSLFPLIETVSEIPSANTEKLHGKILDVLNTTLSGLKALTLSKEPADCLDAFRNFLFSLVQKSGFNIDTPEKAKSVTALIGLAMGRGSAEDSFLVIESLLSIHQKMKSAPKLQVQSYLTQLQDYRKNEDISILFQQGVLDNFQISQSSFSSMKSENRQTDAIASDGTFIYLHVFNTGLQKIGTGYNGTIVGHIYQNSDFRKSDDAKSLVCIKDKLYYLIQKSRSATPSQSKQTSVKEADENILEIAVLNTATLQQQSIIQYSPATAYVPSNRVFLLSDGISLYLLGKQKPGKEALRSSSLQDQDEPKAAYVLDCLSISGETIKSNRSIPLLPAKSTPTESALLPHQYERAVVYTTGLQLIVLVPEVSGSTLNKARVFSMKTGAHLNDHKIKNETFKLITCYDLSLNTIFSYNTFNITAWKNLGPSLQEINAPEAMIAKYNTKLFQPLDCALFILSHICRLARRHPLWDERASILREESPISSVEEAENPFLFVIDPSLNVCKFFCSVVKTALEESQIEEDVQFFIVLTCVRLLKLNFHEFTQQSVTARAKAQPIGATQGVQKLLKEFIDKPPFTGERAQTLQLEACRAYALGLRVFFEKTEDQVRFLLDLLADNSKPSQKLLLQVVFAQLAIWDYAHVLLAPPASAETVEGQLKESSGLAPQKAEKAERKPEFRAAIIKNCERIYTSLFKYVIENDLETLKNSSAETVHPLISPALQLLQGAQREILSNPLFNPALLGYTNCALASLQKLVSIAIERKASDQLRSSALCVLLNPLVTSLAARPLLSDRAFVSNLLLPLTELLRNLDKLNTEVPQVLQADKLYLKRPTDKKEARLVVESKHPYSQGQHQVKQTVSIPGAQYLALKFDHRCRTSNNSSDLLQVFKSSLLIETATNARDGKSLVYSGQNWPKQTQIIKGDTATFLFNANSRPDSRDKQRWGFRCVITELTPTEGYQNLISHWLLDLENMVALLVGRYSASLIEGRSVQEAERKLLPWFENRLFSAGLDPDTTNKASFLEDYIQGKGIAGSLTSWMERQKGSRLLSQVAKKSLETTERYISAVMIKHLGLTSDAEAFAELIKKGRQDSMEASTLNKEAFTFIAHEVVSIGKNLNSLAQSLIIWEGYVDDQISETNFRESLTNLPKETIKNLCVLQNINADGKDEETTTKALWEQLSHQLSQPSTSQGTVFDKACQPVIERAKLLLSLNAATSTVEQPSVETPNPFAFARSDETDDRPMMRSSSYYPQSDKQVSREVKNARNQQKQEAFNRRLTELRKWMQAYKSWKSWQGGLSSDTSLLPPSNPATAIASFVQNRNLQIELFPSLLKAQASRAQSRIEGLKHFSQLISLVSFNSTKQQIIGALGAPLTTGGHILDFISAVPVNLKVSVLSHFNKVLEDIFKILQDRNCDPNARLLALSMCTIAFKDSDVDILRKTGVFSLLQQVIQESKQKIAHLSNELRRPLSSRLNLSQKEPVPETNNMNDEESELKRYSTLRQCAWNSFRILATRVIGWDHTTLTSSEFQIVEREALKDLQTEIFDLMCVELKRLSKVDPVNRDADGDQTSELLSLLLMLSSSSKANHAVKALSKEDNLENLFSILKSPTQPRAKRLALNLLASLLPHKTEASRSLIEFIFSEIGCCLNLQAEDNNNNTKSNPAKKGELNTSGQLALDQIRSSLELSTSNKQESDDEEESEADPSYALYLLTWTLGPARLVEVCQNCLGVDFFGGNPLDRPAIESKVQKLIEEMNDEGRVNLKVTTAANCNLLAQSLSALGASVSVEKVGSKDNEQQNPNLLKVRNMSNPTFWVSGLAAKALSAEYIKLLRSLLALPKEKIKDELLDKDPKEEDPKEEEKENPWTAAIQNLARNALLKLPEVLKGNQEISQTNTTFAALALLGGFVDTVHVGSRVLAPTHDHIKKSAVVISVEGKNCQIIFEGDSTQLPHSVAVSSLQPLSGSRSAGEDHPLVAAFPLSAETLQAFVQGLKVTPEQSSLPKPRFHDLRARAFMALSQLAARKESAQAILKYIPEFLESLRDYVSDVNPSASTPRLHKNLSLLLESRWDQITKPSLIDLRQLVKVSEVVPYHPHTKGAEIWPTSFHIDRNQSFILSNERRKIEYVAQEANPFGRSRNRSPPMPTEVMIPANAYLPPVPEFYFEMTIHQTDVNHNSLLSIGFVPENTRNWGSGSYRYQANAKKTSFTGGSRRQSDYGNRFGKSNVVGCGYNKEEKAIFFTRDGLDQGVAFPNVSLSNMIPAIGLSRGVSVSINFGQEPFKFKLHIEGESEEEKKKRKQEEEEKRKKLAQEEKEKKKKELEEQRKQHMTIAQPLLNMGLSLTKAIYALEQNNWDPNLAADWVFGEHALDDLEEEEEDDEEKEKEKGEGEGNNEKTGSQEENSEQKNQTEGQAAEQPPASPVPVKIDNPEQNYSTTASQSVFLKDNYTYAEELPVTTSKISQEWEDHVIPAIRKFMEKDNFAALEIEEYCTMIRTQLEAGNEKQAKEIIGQIVGDAGAHIAFPSANAGGSKANASALKIEQIRIGDWVAIVKHFTIEMRHWVSSMDKTMGLVGRVKTVDHQNNLILVEFYSPEKANLSQWWYPVKALEKPTQAPELANLPEDLPTLNSRIQKDFEELGKVSGRVLFLNLFSHFAASFKNEKEPLSLHQMLKHLSYENISTSLLSDIESSASPSKFLPILEQRLSSLYSDPSNNPKEITQALVKQMTNTLSDAGRLEAGLEAVAVSQKPPLPVEKVQLPGAKALILTFDRAGTSLPANSQASLTFSFDEAGSEVIATMTDKTKWIPFVIPSNTFFITCQSSAQQKNNCKWKINLTPVHPNFTLTFWLAEFLLKNSKKYVIYPPAFALPLFNSLLDYVYLTKTPSSLKEACFHLLAQLIPLLNGQPETLEKLSEVPNWDRLLPLRQEMIQLHATEKQKGGLFSCYFKSLVELFVTVTENKITSLIGELPDPNEKQPEEKAENKPSLSTSLRDSMSQPALPLPEISVLENEDKTNTQEKEQKGEKDPEDKEKEKGEKKDQDDKPEKEKSDQGAEASSSPFLHGFGADFSPFGSVSNPQGSLYFGFGNSPFKADDPADADNQDSDDEMKQALAFSLQTDAPAETTEASEPPKQPEKKEEAKQAKEKLTQVSWLNDICALKHWLKCFLSNKTENFEEFVREAWQDSKKEAIKDRIILVDNLPILFDANKKEELENTIKRLAGDVALLSGMFMPEDQESKQTKGYCFLEITSPEMVDAVVKKLHRYKLKLGVTTASISEESTRVLSSISLPRGTIKVSKFAEIDLKEQGPKVAEYLQSKLVAKDALTPDFDRVLEEIFFGFSKDGKYLFPDELNEIQRLSNDTTLSEETLDYLFKNYESKTENQRTGLTINGWKRMYLSQTMRNALDTWEEIEKLGYDSNLRKKFFPRFQDALNSQKAFTLQETIYFMDFIENHFSACELSTPLKLTTDHIRPISTSIHPVLSKIPLTSLRLRLVLLQLLNKKLSSYFGYLDLEREWEGSLAQLISQSRDLIFHTNKFDFVFQVLDKVSLTVPPPVANVDRIKLLSKKEKEGDSPQNTMFHIVWQQLANTPAAFYRQKKPLGAEPHFSIKIAFKNENVQGEGGPYRQFFTDISREMKEALPLFVRCPNGQTGIGDNRDKFVIAPSAESETHISQYEFLGRLMGICITTGVRLILDLPNIFWKPLVGLKPVTADLKEIDTTLYTKYLDNFLFESRENLESQSFYNKTFTTTLTDGMTVPLLEGGENMNVDWSNREEYVKLVEMARLNESWAQLNAIQRGLLEVIPAPLIKLLTPQDLEWKVCGKNTIDVNLLKRHTTYSGVSPEANHISYFWHTLREFSQPERRGFLRFVWAQERLPLNDEEFERTKTRMTIKPYGGAADPNNVFPKADTCFFNVMLPEYTSQAIMREKLLFAIAVDSHSMNADAPEEDELATVNSRGRRNVFDYSSESESDQEY